MQRGPCGLCGSVWNESDTLAEKDKGICPNCCPKRSKGIIVDIGRMNPVEILKSAQRRGKV